MAVSMKSCILHKPHVRIFAPCGLFTQPSRRDSHLVRSECNENLPPELRDLKLTEDGLLIDEKTGKVINEFGATRFDVAVRALRGDFDPPSTVENTERTSGVILDSLVQWPSVYEFQFVLKNTAGAAPEALLEELRCTVAKVCEWEIEAEKCSAKERKGGKFVSLTIPAMVRAPQIIDRVFKAVADDSRIIMKY